MQYSTYRTTVRRSPSLPSPNRLRGNLIDMWSRTSAPTASVDWYGFPWLCSAEDELRAVERLERLLHERKSSVRKSPAQEPIGRKSCKTRKHSRGSTGWWMTTKKTCIYKRLKLQKHQARRARPNSTVELFDHRHLENYVLCVLRGSSDSDMYGRLDPSLSHHR